jgi:hypothetical protein
VEEAKKRTGPNFAVHVLINIAEYNHPLATTIEEGAEMAKCIADVADGINCRAERYGHRGGLLQPDRILFPEPPDDLPEGLDWSRGGKGATVPLVEAVKAKGVKIPVWTACRLDPVIGEEYLQKGSLDFVGMTRRILADPELPNKVMLDSLEDIRWCNGCLHCFDVRNKNMRLECRTNATLGRELEPDFISKPPQKKKKVLVVGGGPSGMEAARVAAKRGHEVVLYEKGSFLGGLIPGDRMTIDDLDNLWPWLKQNSVPIWAGVEYLEINNKGLQVSLKDKRKYILKGKNVITTQDWGPNHAVAGQFKDLVAETYVIGSCKDPGLIVDAMRDGAVISRKI